MRFESHGRPFDLPAANRLFGRRRAAAMAAVLKRHLDDIAGKTAVERAGHFGRMLGWIAGSLEGKPSPFATSVRGPERRELLQSLVHAWHASERATSKVRATGQAEYFNHALRVLDVLAEAGELPRIVRPRMPPNYHRAMSHRPTAAELSRDEGLDSPARIMREALRFGDGGEEARRYLEALGTSASASRLASPTELAKAIGTVNDARLAIVRSVSERKFLHWSAVYDEGQRLVAEGEPLDSGVLQDFRDGAPLARLHVRSFVLGVGAEEGKRRFARLVADGYGGLMPDCRMFGDDPCFRQIMLRFGGSRHVRGWFGAHEDCVAATGFIYMLESNANLAVTVALSPGCESRCDEPGFATISSVKNRPSPRDIVEDLPVVDPKLRVTAVEAIRKTKAMTEVYRAHAPELADSLLVFRWFSHPSAASGEFLAQRLSYFLRETELRDVALTPACLRPSLLLKVGLASGGSVAAVRARGDHSGEDVAEGYTTRYPVRLLYVAAVRRCQDRFESDVMTPAAHDGKAGGRFAGPDDGLPGERTGCGVVCLDRLAGFQPRVPEGEPCDLLDGCAGCDGGVFHATVDNVADALLTRDHLLSHREQWEASRPERWLAAWLPLLAYVEVALEKVRRSRWAFVVPLAEARVAELRAGGYALAPLH